MTLQSMKALELAGAFEWAAVSDEPTVHATGLTWVRGLGLATGRDVALLSETALAGRTLGLAPCLVSCKLWRFQHS